MASYIVGVLTKHNLERYQDYAMAGFRLIDGVEVEVGLAEQPEVLEGSFPGTSIIIMKFADDAAARKWYDSEGYQEVIPIRQESAETHFVITFQS
ncbi:MAG: DUF1330 domain-containing protein [Novosphingobium sp.]|jgi:uncharacterized protein (DUF1330 family)|nr:DUF1330 domain-containing protein [Novosphingobium sp.]MCP5380088.1 DUF1330 domain-containing protein [Novosphingobium sp.]MCP5388291.1 DUF1330 domain-containing protein [Novosphingobium sp.]